MSGNSEKMGEKKSARQHNLSNLESAGKQKNQVVCAHHS